MCVCMKGSTSVCPLWALSVVVQCASKGLHLACGKCHSVARVCISALCEWMGGGVGWGR